MSKKARPISRKRAIRKTGDFVECPDLFCEECGSDINHAAGDRVFCGECYDARQEQIDAMRADLDTDSKK